jgi:hypothetical protein
MTVTITSNSSYVVSSESQVRTEVAGVGHQMVVVPKPDPSIAQGVAVSTDS